MTKYSLETKLQIVTDYEAGKGGFRTLAKKYQIAQSIVKRWIHNYQDFGLEGLQVKSTRQSYPLETKLYAIELYLTTELSYREVGVQLGI
ncbi:helix-turn-helix domain-containing protein, partial [Dolosicoccus paucivorans]